MSAPPKLLYERLRLDRLQNFDIPPLVAEALEQAPGCNVLIANDAIARGCGHYLDRHYASGLCAACVIRNSLESGTNTPKSTSVPERWVSDYAQRYLASNIGSVVNDVSGPRWVRLLTGDAELTVSAVPEWSGLRDTPRERVAAAQRYAEFRAAETELAALRLEPGVERGRLNRRRQAFLQMQSQCRAVLTIMSGTVIEDDVQERLDAFFAIPVLDLGDHKRFVAYEQYNNSEFDDLRGVRFNDRKARMERRRKRGEEVMEVLPLRATLPRDFMNSLDAYYVSGELELPPRDERGLRRYSELVERRAAQLRAQIEEARHQLAEDVDSDATHDSMPPLEPPLTPPEAEQVHADTSSPRVASSLRAASPPCTAEQLQTRADFVAALGLAEPATARTSRKLHVSGTFRTMMSRLRR